MCSDKFKNLKFFCGQLLVFKYLQVMNVEKIAYKIYNLTALFYFVNKNIINLRVILLYLVIIDSCFFDLC